MSNVGKTFYSVLLIYKHTVQPYEETLLLAIARNESADNKEMEKVTIQISSNDTYSTIVHKVSGARNSIIEQDFTSNVTSLAIFYTEENTEFIKDCSHNSFFKCWAEKTEETEKFNCTKKCIPLTYDFLMDAIDHSIPKCKDPIEKDEYCMLGVKGYGIASKLKSTCMNQCRYKGTTLESTEFEQSPLFLLGNDMNVLSWPYLKKDLSN